MIPVRFAHFNNSKTCTITRGIFSIIFDKIPSIEELYQILF